MLKLHHAPNTRAGRIDFGEPSGVAPPAGGLANGGSQGGNSKDAARRSAARPPQRPIDATLHGRPSVI